MMLVVTILANTINNNDNNNKYNIHILYKRCDIYGDWPFLFLFFFDKTFTKRKKLYAIGIFSFNTSIIRKTSFIS